MTKSGLFLRMFNAQKQNSEHMFELVCSRCRWKRTGTTDLNKMRVWQSIPKQGFGKHLLVGSSQRVHSPSSVWQHVVDVALHLLANRHGPAADSLCHWSAVFRISGGVQRHLVEYVSEHIKGCSSPSGHAARAAWACGKASHAM